MTTRVTIVTVNRLMTNRRVEERRTGNCIAEIFARVAQRRRKGIRETKTKPMSLREEEEEEDENSERDDWDGDSFADESMIGRNKNRAHASQIYSSISGVAKVVAARFR
jgi:hypothetical protein